MKRLARLVAGYTLVAAGTVMLVTPGPGIITIAGGVALLAEDVRWAGRLSEWAKAKTGKTTAPDDVSDQAGG